MKRAALILIVEDEKDLAEIVSEILKMAGFKTMQAYNGQQALDIVEKNKPDAMILDLKMPVMDGYGVIERLRSRPDFKELPILIMTTLLLEPSRWLYLKSLGSEKILIKPFKTEEVVAYLKRVTS